MGREGKTMKFKNRWDEYLYDSSVGSGVVTGDGDVTGPVGWFGAVTLQPGFSDDVDLALSHYGTPYLILHESNEGFVTVLTFERQTDRDVRVGELQRAHALGVAGVTEREIRLAIDNYLQAAIFTATDENGTPLEDSMRNWTADAQRRAAAEVTDFVTQNIDAVRAFQAATGHRWEQIGIDFSLSRNGHGAGFWDRGAGEPGQVLTEAAHAWGEVSVFINEDGEVDFT